MKIYSVSIRKYRDLYAFSVPYIVYEHHADLIRQGLYWNKNTKLWTTRYFSNALRIAKELENQKIPVYWNTVEYDLYRLSQSTEPFAKPLIPQHPDARPYQIAAAQYLLAAKKVILADEMGLGKTFEVILAIQALYENHREKEKEPLKVTIVCPAHLKYVWLDEFERFARFNTIIEIIGLKRLIKLLQDEHPEQPPIRVYIVSYDVLSRNLSYLEIANDGKINVLVCDEAHYLKNGSAKRTKATMSIVKDLNPEYRWLVTGTPITRDAMNIYSLLKILEHPLSTNWYYFATRYAAAEQVSIRGRKVWKFGISNEIELRETLLATCMIRRTKSMVAKDLPEKIRQLILLPPDEVISLIQKEKEILKAMSISLDLDQKEIYTRLGETGMLPRTSQLAQIRQELAISKIPAVVNFILDILEQKPEEKIVVFAWHISVVYALVKALQSAGVRNIVQITGEESSKSKAALISTFQNSPGSMIAICTIGAVGTGVTLTAASTGIFVEIDWIPASVMQAEDRLHRIGQKNNVTIYYFTYPDSLEAYITRKMLRRKEKIQRFMNVSHGGV